MKTKQVGVSGSGLKIENRRVSAVPNNKNNHQALTIQDMSN